DTIVLIFATAALMEVASLRAAIHQFEAVEESAEMISVARYPAPIEWAMRMDESGQLHPAQPEKLSVRSQDLEEGWYETAEFVIYDERSLLEKNINILRMGFPIQYLSIDIDSIEDWVLAEKLAESKK
ncbi:MAG: hypothetical protein HOB39_01360, partial [Gammaproteobacteria bacterium]|nr:hypothetical protein [Gammaproteobacteria bacterium]